MPAHAHANAYAVLPLRDMVVFPHMIVPLFVGRDKSIRALEEVMKSDRFILLATQKNASDDDPLPDSIYEIGTLASVLQLLKLPDGTPGLAGLGVTTIGDPGWELQSVQPLGRDLLHLWRRCGALQALV